MPIKYLLADDSMATALECGDEVVIRVLPTEEHKYAQAADGCEGTVPTRHQGGGDRRDGQVIIFVVLDRCVGGDTAAMLEGVFTPLGDNEGADALKRWHVHEVAIAARIISKMAAVGATRAELAVAIALRDCDGHVAVHGTRPAQVRRV